MTGEIEAVLVVDNAVLELGVCDRGRCTQTHVPNDDATTVFQVCFIAFLLLQNLLLHEAVAGLFGFAEGLVTSYHRGSQCSVGRLNEGDEYNVSSGLV